jgi:hypothetical protein
MLDIEEPDPVQSRIIEQARSGMVRITQHAQQEMVEEEILLEEVLEAIMRLKKLEDYPYHKRGPCCLLGGATHTGRQLHVVCTTALPLLVIITTYEPLPPKWLSPTQRRYHP